MIYFFTFQTKDGLDYAAVENKEQAAKYIAAGWKRVGHAAYIAAWKAKHLKERTVGG